MRRAMHKLRALALELQRRQVYRVAVLYAACGFALLQGADLLVGARIFPAWTVPLGVVVFAVGFPVAVALSWAFQLTPEGIRADATAPHGLGGWLARGIVLGTAVVTSGGIGWLGWTLWVSAETPPALVAPEPAPPNPARVAVLYFDDHSPDGELGYLAAGLSETLLHELAQVPDLEVVSRNAVKAYRDGDVSLDSLVSALRVGCLVEGSVSRSDGRIKVAVQLVDAATGAHLDSRLIERPDGDLFALEGELAREVARALRRRLGREIRLREWRSGATSVAAWTLRQRALELRDEYARLWKLNPDVGVQGLRTADSLLAKAQTQDTGWVELPVARGWLAYDLSLRLADRPGGLDSAWSRVALDHAHRALALDPDHAAARELQGVVLAGMAARPGGAGPGLEEAETALRRAVQLDPRAVRAWSSLSTLLFNQNRFEEARYAARHALEADAFLEDAASVVLTLYESAVKAGPEEEARRWCEEGRRRFPENANFVLCRLFLLASFPQVDPDLDHAWSLLDTLLQVASTRNAAMFRGVGGMQVAKVAARAGLSDSARAIIRQTRGTETPAWLAYDEAHARLLLDEPDAALRLLPKYLALYPDTTALARDWWFQDLHDHPRFRALIGS